MQRIDLSPPQADPRLDQAIDWLAQASGAAWQRIAPASADASFRRYFRVTAADGATAIVMDAPPPQEDVRPFLNVTALLLAGGVQVPEVLASDVEHGFLLLRDLGGETYLSALQAEPSAAVVQGLFDDAIDALVTLQGIDPAGASQPLPRYDAALLRRELDLFPEWYLRRHLQLTLSDEESQALERVFGLLIASALAQPTVLVHRDYMPRNLMLTAARNPGVLDYQDAVIGPISYDVASLFRDAFISWEEPQVIDFAVRYWERARKAGLPVREDFSEFYREMEWMGLQRHLKVLGIFARINYRDGKPKYLGDTPRFVQYVRHAAGRYGALAPLNALFDRIEGRVAEVGYTF